MSNRVVYTQDTLTVISSKTDLTGDLELSRPKSDGDTSSLGQREARHGEEIAGKGIGLCACR